MPFFSPVLGTCAKNSQWVGTYITMLSPEVNVLRHEHMSCWSESRGHIMLACHEHMSCWSAESTSCWPAMSTWAAVLWAENTSCWPAMSTWAAVLWAESKYVREGNRYNADLLQFSCKLVVIMNIFSQCYSYAIEILIMSKILLTN